MQTNTHAHAPRLRPLLTLATIALVLSGCGGGADDPATSAETNADTGSQASPAATGVNEVPDAFAAKALTAINALRAQPRTCGAQAYPAAPALGWHTTLATISVSHSLDMKQGNFFDHQGSDGSDVGTRATAAGYPWRSIGENIAVGQQTVDEVVADWAISEGHCVNIMSANSREMALAVIPGDAGNSFSSYWTMVIGYR